jgi:hypothetical protein
MCFCAKHAFELTDPEADFVARLLLSAARGWASGWAPSARQVNWLDSIYSRLRRTVKP